PEGAGQARPGQSSPVAASPLDISGVQSEASSCSGGKRVRFAAARQVRVVSRWMRPGIHTYCASPQEVRVGWCQWLHLCSDSDHQIRAENLIADLAAEERSSNSLPRKSALRSTTDKSLPKKRVTFRDAVTIKHVSKPGQFSHVQNGSRIAYFIKRWLKDQLGVNRTKTGAGWMVVGVFPIKDSGHRVIDTQVFWTPEAARGRFTCGSAATAASRRRNRYGGTMVSLVVAQQCCIETPEISA
ncbi:hypothetical protein McanCB49686_004824, partial [Microsporum canis]